MPIFVRFIAVVILIGIFSVTVDPLKGDSLSLLFFYWVIKGSICLCTYIVVGHIYERIFTPAIARLSLATNLLVLQGVIMALCLTLIDLPLESLLPMKEEFVETTSAVSLIEEIYVHWMAILPLTLLSLFADPVFGKLKYHLLNSHFLTSSSSYTANGMNAEVLFGQVNYEQASHEQAKFSKPAIELTATADIHRIEAAEHYVLVYYQNRKEMIKSSFSSFLSQLTNINGLQVHRSHWVNLEQVEGTEKSGRKLSVVMKNGDKLPVSNSFRQLVLDTLTV